MYIFSDQVPNLTKGIMRKIELLTNSLRKSIFTFENVIPKYKRKIENSRD